MSMFARIVFVCLPLLPLVLNAASPLRVEVSAKGAILMNAETGAVLWEKNAHTPLFPASTTKMITALYAVEKKGFQLDEMVTASYEAVSAVPASVRRAVGGSHPPYRLEFGGTHMGIKVGETLPLRTLLYGLMLASGNDAANVIAQHVSGDISKFMEELNVYVRSKGCKNTVLRTPHGLPNEEHKTSAYDMAILAREFMKNDVLREVAKTTQYTRQETNKQPESMLHQHNALVKPGRFYYPKAIGIKTGYTVTAGYTLVTAAEDQERKLIVVLLGCEKIEQRYKDAIALFEAGFNEKKVSRTLFSKGFDLFSYQVEGGKIPLQAYLSQDVLLAYYPSEEPTFKTAVLWQPPAVPIASGQKVAELQILSPEGKVLTSAPLFAVRTVDATMRHQAILAWKKVKKGLWDNVTLVMASGGIIILASTFYYSHKPKRKRSKAHKGK
ncbi:MAG: D-alanyl-D-alanine carboxypeptidase [Verrucomicrobia bacterium]|nr:D-alanyl-D-alanine carboxypeptidase [Verrucomicrobiota bacterium]